MRFIYTDEAGTSASEPVCVVASVILDPDRDLLKILQDMRQAIEFGVPESYRTNFIFHATEVFNGGKKYDKDLWPRDDRIDFLKSFLCIPFVNSIPITLGKVYKGHSEQFIGNLTRALVMEDVERISEPSDKKVKAQRVKSLRIDGNSMAHVMAFQLAMERADWFLRECLGGAEFGAIYAEDIPHMRETLRTLGLALRDVGRGLTLKQRKQGGEVSEGQQPDFTYRITKITEQPSFLPKSQNSILQLADACAFAFRSYFSRQSHGEDLMLAMLGVAQANEVFSDTRWHSGRSSGLFNTKT